MNVIATALYSKLTGGTALTALLNSGTAIYRTQAPEGAALPYIVFSLYAGGPLNITSSDMRDIIYYIRGYGTTTGQAGSIDYQVSSLLHKGTIAVTGYTTYNLIREQDIELPEDQPNGQTIFGFGGLYRISIDD